jgi:hypothetical protein
MATLSAISSHLFKLDKVYDPAAYDTLPSLRQAHSLITKDAITKLQGPIRKAFLDHKVQSHYKGMHRSLAVLGWKLPYRELQ